MMRAAAPLRPAMDATTLSNCRILARMAEYASRLHAPTQLDERGHAPAFGIDMTNPAHADWLADIMADLLVIVHRAERIGDYAPAGREFDERGPR